MVERLTCPNCGRDAHPVCGNPECVCLTNIPGGELPLTHHWQIGYLLTSDKIGNWLWKLWWKLGLGNRIHPGQFMLELERCPYCRFTNSIDFWFERSMQMQQSATRSA